MNLSTDPAHPEPTPSFKVPWWTRGDTNAFFGLGFNILVNVLILTVAVPLRGPHPDAEPCSARSCPRWASR